MNLSSFIAGLGGPLLFCIAIISFFVAVSVYLDAQKLKAADPYAVKILAPGLWALVCLFGNIPALALYWAAHHSTWAK